MLTLAAGDTRISYFEAGAGETVVLLHASASSSAQWRDLADRLAPRYRVLAPDLPGYGRTPAPADQRRLHLADEAALVEAVATLADGPVHLVGHSYGGAVALRVALDARVPLRSLTLIEPVSFHVLLHSDPWGGHFFAEVSALIDHIARSLANGTPAAAMARFVDYWNGSGTWARLPARRQSALARRAHRLALDFWATVREPTPAEAYSAIDVPTLLLCGARSPAPTRRIVDLLEAVMPAARFETVPEAGHMLPLTHPDAVHGLVVRHLDTAATPARQAA